MMRNFTQFFLLSMVFVFAGSHLRAQSYSDFLDQRINWNDRSISWDDFRAPIPSDAADTTVFVISLASEPIVENLKSGRTEYKYYSTKTYMQPSTSWCRPGAKTPNNLKLAQLKFDLWELYSRKCIIEYTTSTRDLDWSGISAYYNTLFNRKTDEISQNTNRGENLEELERYSEQVAQELEETVFDPVASVNSGKYTYGVFSSIGVQAHFPTSEYVSPAYGIDLLGGFYANSYFFGFSLDISGARCNKDIYTSEGLIAKGDDLLAGSLNMLAGKNAWRKRGCSITPFVGIGVKFYDGGEKYKYERESDKTTEKGAFSTGVGILVDIPLRHMVDMRVSSPSGFSTSDQSLQIRPYLSYNKFHGDMGWVPSINIAVSYSWGTLSKFKMF